MSFSNDDDDDDGKVIANAPDVSLWSSTCPVCMERLSAQSAVQLPCMCANCIMCSTCAGNIASSYKKCSFCSAPFAQKDIKPLPLLMRNMIAGGNNFCTECKSFIKEEHRALHVCGGTQEQVRQLQERLREQEEIAAAVEAARRAQQEAAAAAAEAEREAAAAAAAHQQQREQEEAEEAAAAAILRQQQQQEQQQEEASSSSLPPEAGEEEDSSSTRHDAAETTTTTTTTTTTSSPPTSPPPARVVESVSTSRSLLGPRVASSQPCVVEPSRTEQILTATRDWIGGAASVVSEKVAGAATVVSTAASQAWASARTTANSNGAGAQQGSSG